MVITNDNQRTLGICQELFLRSINVQQEPILTMINPYLITLNDQVIYLLQKIILIVRCLDTVTGNKLAHCPVLHND